MKGDDWTMSQAGFAGQAIGVWIILDRAMVADYRKQSRQRCRPHGRMDVRLRGDGRSLFGKRPQVRASTLFLYRATVPACGARFATLWNRRSALWSKRLELDWRSCSGRRHLGVLRSGTAAWQICWPTILKSGLTRHSVSFREQYT
jgi:hypothetical protein